MNSPLGSSLANAFLTYHEQNWLDSCHLEHRTLNYWRYVNDIFVIFKLSDHLKRFQNHLNSCHVNMPFIIKTEQNNKISFSDVNVIREQGKFMKSVYRKPTFSGLYTNFDRFLPDNFKIGMIHTLVNRCSGICCSWIIFLQQLILLREILQKNGYPEKVIDRCVKLFLSRINILKQKLPTVGKKPLRLVLSYLGTVSLQTRTKLQKSIKALLNCCKLHVIF